MLDLSDHVDSSGQLVLDSMPRFDDQELEMLDEMFENFELYLDWLIPIFFATFVPIMMCFRNCCIACRRRLESSNDAIERANRDRILLENRAIQAQVIAW